MGYLDNTGLARFWSDVKDVLLGPGKATSSTDDADSLAKGVYYWQSASDRPLHVPTNVPWGMLIGLSAGVTGAPSIQFVIPSDPNSNYETGILFRTHDDLLGWESWRKFQTMNEYDSSPASGSDNAITSGAVYTALASKIGKSDVFGLGTKLGASDNLDSTTSAGCYYWIEKTDNVDSVPTNVPKRALSSTADSVLNATMWVFVNAYTNRYTQIVLPTGHVDYSGLYIRSYYSSGWEDWKYIETTSHYDTTPTTGSSNACTSGGIASALAVKASMADVLGSSATELTSNNDLDDISDVGSYYWVSSRPTNCPKLYGTTGSNLAYPALMYVLKLGGTANKIQMVMPFASACESVYFRYISSTPKGDWKVIQPTAEFDTTPTSSSTRGITSGGVFTAIRNNANGRGSAITSSTTSHADLNTYTTPGRYYSAAGSGCYTILHSPLAAMGFSTTDGKKTIDDVTVTFNGSLHLIVEQAGTSSSSYLVQTVYYVYASSTNSSGANLGRSIARSNVFRRTKDAGIYGTSNSEWSNWYQYTGTEIIPDAGYNTQSSGQSELMGGSNLGGNDEDM